MTEACQAFTCRGPRHEDDPTVEMGDNYIKTGLWADLDAGGITRTWAAVFEGAIAGYVGLAADAVRLTRSEQKRAELEGIQFSRYGCVQIAMIAVRADLQERDDMHVGRALVDHAVLVGLDAGRQIGARFLVADVNPPAQGFYERCGFVSLTSQEEQEQAEKRGLVPMVLDLHPSTS